METNERISTTEVAELLKTRGYISPHQLINQWVKKGNVSVPTWVDGTKMYLKKEIQPMMEKVDNSNRRNRGCKKVKNSRVREVESTPETPTKKVMLDMPSHVQHYISIIAKKNELTVLEVISKLATEYVEELLEQTLAEKVL